MSAHPTDPDGEAAEAHAALAAALASVAAEAEAHVAARRRSIGHLADWTGPARRAFDAEGATLLARLGRDLDRLDAARRSLPR